MDDIDAGVETTEVGSDLESGVEAEVEVSSAETEDSTDWKTIAEKERERAENYKKAFTQKREFVKAGQTTPPTQEEDEEDKPLTRREFEELLQQKVVPLVSHSKEDTLLAQKVSDPAKREYVKMLLETRIVRTGTSDRDIENDIADAIAMADRKKTEKTIAELTRAANNKPQAPSAGSSNEPTPQPKQHRWTAEQARALENRAKQLGVDPERFKKDAWENQKKTRIAG